MNAETRELVFKMSNGFCSKCLNIGTEIHHRLSKSKVNVKLYPLFIDSPMNLQLLCYDCHHNKPLDKIRPEEAAIYERWLEMFRKGEV